MLFFMMFVFGIITILATIFASDIRNFVTTKAIEWESNILELSPEVKKKLKNLKELRAKAKAKKEPNDNNVGNDTKDGESEAT